MFEPTYVKDLNQRYTGVSVRLNTIKTVTDRLIGFYSTFDRYQDGTYEELYQHISPSIRNNTYKIFEESGQIYGFMNWAFVNNKVLDRFMETGELGTLDWQSGFKMVWVDALAKRDIDQMAKWLRDYTVNLLGENVRVYWLKINGEQIRAKVKMRTKKSWRTHE